MKKLLLLLLGLLLIFILSYFCFTGKAEGVQSDLLTKAQTAYSGESMTWVSPKIKGQDLKTTRILTLTGVTDNIEAKEKAEKIAQTIEGITSIDNQIIVKNASTVIPIEKTPTLATVNPYILNAEMLKNKDITLNGYVPNLETHQQIVNKAETLYGKEHVTDNLKEASTAPTAWAESVNLGLDKLATMDYGHFEMKDETFNFEGFVGTDEDKNNLLDGLKNNLAENYVGSYNIDVPKVEVAVAVAPTVSPYTLNAEMLKNKDITLNGYVPNIETHQQIVAKAETLYGKDHLTDNLKEASTAPTAWGESVNLGLDKLATMDYGHFEMKDETFNFEGFVGTDKDKNNLLDGLKNNLPENYVDTYNIQAPKIITEKDLALTCQEEFKSYLSTEKINFAYDKALIKKESYLLLGKLIEVAKSCPDSKLVIEGHTDSDGSKRYNQKLSEKRANAVKIYLERHGISKERLESIGYGELQPIASNKTKAGKKENRRIEINVKGVK